MTKQYPPFVSSVGQEVHQVGICLTRALYSLNVASITYCSHSIAGRAYC